jgi:hypothetical protein
MIADVGLYADPLGTGLAPRWEPRSYADDLRDCQRYWCKFQYSLITSAYVAGGYIGASYVFPTTMRIAPATAMSTTDGTPSNVASAAVDQATTTQARCWLSTTAIGTATLNQRTCSVNARY